MTLGEDANVVLWDVETSNPKVVGPMGESWQSAEFSADGNRLMLAGPVAGICVVEVPSGTVVFRSRVRAIDKMMYCAAMSSDGKRVAAGFASDGFTGVWAVEPAEGDAEKK